MVVGIGNIYRSELCFLAGVAPTTPVGGVPDLPRVVRRAKAILEANKERTVQSTTGDLRRGRRTWVYSRAVEPCRRCGTRIEQELQGPPGRERAVWWCPSCQR
jgi:endonuclease-8